MLILSHHLCLDFADDPFPSGFFSWILRQLIYFIRATSPLLISLDSITLIKYDETYNFSSFSNGKYEH